jgi:hypothetical protein
VTSWASKMAGDCAEAVWDEVVMLDAAIERVIRATIEEAARRAEASTNVGDTTCAAAAARILAMLEGP